MILGPTLAEQCALIDPNCYEFVQGEGWSRTVPTGKTWWVTNLWNVSINSSSRPWFHRALDIDRALCLPAGTVIAPIGGGYPYPDGNAFICKPELLVTPPNMTVEQQLASRLALLRSLPLFVALVDMPAGSAHGAYNGFTFPTDFSLGMVRHVFDYNVSWVTMVGNLDTSESIIATNTHDEISDSHAQRFSGNTLQPFLRSTDQPANAPGFNGIWVQQGSRSGNYSDASSEDGWGGMLYQKLPAGY